MFTALNSWRESGENVIYYKAIYNKAKSYDHLGGGRKMPRIMLKDLVPALFIQTVGNGVFILPDNEGSLKLLFILQ